MNSITTFLSEAKDEKMKRIATDSNARRLVSAADRNVSSAEKILSKNGINVSKIKNTGAKVGKIIGSDIKVGLQKDYDDKIGVKGPSRKRARLLKNKVDAALMEIQPEISMAKLKSTLTSDVRMNSRSWVTKPASSTRMV